MDSENISGNRLPRHETPQGLLEYVRTSRKERELYSTSEGSTSISNDVQGTIPINENNDRGDENKRTGKTSTIYGGSTGNSGVPSSNGSTTYETRSTNREVRGRDSSVYQLETGTRIAGKRNNFTEGIKNAFTPITSFVKKQNQDKQKDTKKDRRSDYKKLNDTEAIKIRPKLIEFFKWSSDHLDEFIQATTKGHQSVEIWSTLEEEEIEILVDFLIQRGKTNPETAQLVRNMSVLMDRIKLAVIIVPRMYQTALTYINRGISIK